MTPELDNPPPPIPSSKSWGVGSGWLEPASSLRASPAQPPPPVPHSPGVVKQTSVRQARVAVGRLLDVPAAVKMTTESWGPGSLCIN